MTSTSSPRGTARSPSPYRVILERALLTYHDVGLNHRTCFQPLFVCAGPSSDLVRRFRVHHIDAPGCQDGGVDGNLSDASPRTLDALAEQVEDVVKHFGLRECVGLGVGAGATVMALYAGRHSSACKALMLVAPSCGRAGDSGARVGGDL